MVPRKVAFVNWLAHASWPLAQFLHFCYYKLLEGIWLFQRLGDHFWAIFVTIFLLQWYFNSFWPFFKWNNGPKIVIFNSFWPLFKWKNGPELYFIRFWPFWNKRPVNGNF